MKIFLNCFLLLLISITSMALGGNAYLGVYTQNLDREEGGGVLVLGVTDGSGAAKAGIKQDDVILTINGKAVKSRKELIDLLGGFEPGDEVAVELLRLGKSMNLVASLGEKSRLSTNVPGGVRWLHLLDEDSAWLGIQLLELNSQLAEYFGVSDGILVREVTKASPAEAAGLQAGDILLNWEGTAVGALETFYKAMADAKAGDRVSLTVKRREKEMTLTVDLGSSKDKPGHSQMFNFFSDNLHKGQFNSRALEQFGENFSWNFNLGKLPQEEIHKLHLKLMELQKQVEELKKE